MTRAWLHGISAAALGYSAWYAALTGLWMGAAFLGLGAFVALLHWFVGNQNEGE